MSEREQFGCHGVQSKLITNFNRLLSCCVLPCYSEPPAWTIPPAGNQGIVYSATYEPRKEHISCENPHSIQLPGQMHVLLFAVQSCMDYVWLDIHVITNGCVGVCSTLLHG